MTMAAIEALETQTHYEVWKRELGSGNIRPHGTGRVTYAARGGAHATAERLNEREPQRHATQRALYTLTDGETKPPVLWFYFVLVCKTTREWDND